MIDMWVLAKDKRWCIYVLSEYIIYYKSKDRDIKICYDRKQWIKLNELWIKYWLSWERIRQIINTNRWRT